MALRVTIGVIWILSLLAGRGAWHSASPSGSAATSARVTDQQSWSLHATPGAPAADGDLRTYPRVDLFGNEIDDALAEYRLDRRGSVYERHAPDTALPKLGSPTS